MLQAVERIIELESLIPSKNCISITELQVETNQIET